MLKPMHTQAASSEAFGNLRNNWRICERSDEVHLVVDEFGQAEELGFRQCDLPKSANTHYCAVPRIIIIFRFF